MGGFTVPESQPPKGPPFDMQTHGSLFNIHPHVHALVLPGLVREGCFHELKGCSATAFAVRFRAGFLTALKNQEVLRFRRNRKADVVGPQLRIQCSCGNAH